MRFFNLTTPRSDYDLISPWIISTESTMKVMRIKKIIKTKEAHNCHTNSPYQCLKKIQGAVWRNYILMWGCEELRHPRVTKQTSIKFWDFAVIHLPQLSTHYCKSTPFGYNSTALIPPTVSLEFCPQELKLYNSVFIHNNEMS